MSHPDEVWLRRYLAPLVGGKIVYVTVEPDEMGYAPFPVIHVDKDGQRLVLEISADEEGNGPGFIHGLPVPEREES